MKQIPRYGMRHSSIRYWQQQAFDLFVYNGIFRGVSTFDARNLPLASARNIGHAAIGLAAVMSPARLRAIFGKV